MKTFNMNVTDMPTNTIGFGGENGVTEVVLDFGAWAEEYGQGAISLLVKRAMDTHPYPAVLTTEGTTATWVITDVETSYKGHGEAQWIYTVGEQIKKSAVFGFNVNRSLNSPVAETPEAYQTWVDDMIALGAGVEQIAEQVYEATGHYPKVENGYWYVWSVVEEDWVNTNQKAQGEQGIPGVGISSTVLNPDYTLTITFTDGSSYTTPPIKGEKGDTGNGISSTVLNPDYTLTITFTNGTTYTTPSIRGVPGQDYVITSADYDEIASRVDTMIDSRRQQALDDIDGAKTNAVSDVTLEGTTQKGLVTSEGTTQVGLVNAKGQEVIQSIPSDYSGLSADVSELKSDFTHLENDKADIIVSSASGAIASFSDGANYPVKQTVFTMNPVQDLHGEEHPFPAGAKNKIPLAVDTIKSLNSNGAWSGNAYNYNGLTFTILTNSGNEVTGISVSGTANGSTYFSLSPVLPWSAGSIINGCPSGGANTRFGLGLRANGSDWDYGDARTISADISSAVSIWFANGYVASNVVFKPMIRLSSVTDATFAPYKNICPILGHTEVDAVRTGKNLFANTDDENNFGCAYANKLYVSSFGNYMTTERTETGFVITRRNAVDVGFKILLGYFGAGDVFTLSFDCNIVSGFKISYTDTDELPSVSPGLSYTDVLTNQNHVITCTASSAGYYWLGLYETTTTVWTFTNVMLERSSTASTYETFNGQSVTYQLGQTVYAGALTINEDGSGQIVSTMASVDLGTLNWVAISQGNNVFYAPLAGAPSNTGTSGIPNIVCSQYAKTSAKSNTAWGTFTGDMVVSLGCDAARVYVRDSRYSDVTDFSSAMNSVQLVYELATPVTIQLTEQEVIETLYGNNNVWHSANGDTEVTYRADTKKYIDNKFAELQTLIANL